ncbi:MAG: DNA mismatch repair endonuclease MutL [Eubacteriales bacterium]|nr:DNA mismatch repair endonuclease MutL [Eubacteriales bacterium]
MELLSNNRIIELSRNVANKIAAGEVVNRPLSIVKELLENSIDAGAKSIIVEIKNGGKTYIRVTDDGSGIRKDDVGLAFKRHATSKLKDASDLDHIQSLGFRGEALASIAAVSKVELITKTSDEKTGTCIQIEGGEFIAKEEIGCPEGTTIIVEDVFYNTPARLKFMKTDAAESALIIDFISKITLAYPQIKIRLINNGNILFSTPGKGDIFSSILTIYSKEIGEKLIHLKESNEQMFLEVFVSPPSYTKTNRKNQIFFVNGRYISSKVMENAVADAYTEKLFSGRYPVVFLFLNVTPEKLDVNIHPNKKEVRFEEEGSVKDFITTVIRKALKTEEAIPEIHANNLFKFDNSGNKDKNFTENNDKSAVTLKDIIPKNKNIDAAEEQIDIKKLLYQKRNEVEQFNETEESYEPEDKGHKKTAVTESTQETTAIKELDLLDLTLTGSVFGTYITAFDDNYLYLIDQHAAHERIFYEQLLEQYHNEEKLQQIIMMPLIINVTHFTKSAAENMLDFLGNFGFTVEEFGPTALIVKSIPVFMDFNEAKDFIEYLLDNVQEKEVLENQNKINKIITSACKKSVKAHDVLDKQEIERLIADLSKTKNPYSCPHGRPTFIRLSQYEIEKMFKRV